MVWQGPNQLDISRVGQGRKYPDVFAISDNLNVGGRGHAFDAIHESVDVKAARTPARGLDRKRCCGNESKGEISGNDRILRRLQHLDDWNGRDGIAPARRPESECQDEQTEGDKADDCWGEGC